MKKVLIIKLGYSETMDSGISRIPSLGDVLRTTVILYPFAGDQVTWLVDAAAYPLLQANPLISRVLVYDLNSVLQLQRERFDAIVNLEKTPGVCAFADSLSARKRYGFRYDAQKGKAEPHDGCEKVFSLCNSVDLKRTHKKSWQESLLQIVRTKWEGQEYILGYKPNTAETFDVGLNWAVGRKWPNKAWPMKYWEGLTTLLDGLHSYSMQQGLDNLYEYMDWINSCRLLVTNDSLGLHIAIALRKKVVVLYGPTNPNETHFYGRAEALYPEIDYDCIPCLSSSCTREKSCMEFIFPAQVKNGIDTLLCKIDPVL